MNTVIEKPFNWIKPHAQASNWLIAGPCSAESPNQVFETFTQLKQLNVNAFRVGIWKPRTRPNSFEGLGADALVWVKEAAVSCNKPVMVEVASPKHVEACLKAGIDMLWVGARTTVSPFMVQELADSLKGVSIPVFVKNPVNPDLELWIGAIERFAQANIEKIAGIHRGFSTYEKLAYRNNPHWEIPIELRRRMPHLPIICDPSHIAGIAHLVADVAQQALNLGFDGLMIESHKNPSAALSDAQQQLLPNELVEIIEKLVIRNQNCSENQAFFGLQAIRKEIDAIDSDIISLLAQRLSFAKELADIKLKNNLTIYQPERWQEIVTNKFLAADKLGLPKEFLLKIWQTIHHQSINTQAMFFDELKKAHNS